MEEVKDKVLIDSVAQVPPELPEFISKFEPKNTKITEDERDLLSLYKVKWCPKCKSVRKITEFSVSSTKDGLDSKCKRCSAEVRTRNRQQLNERAKQYYSDNREDKKAQQTKYRNANPDKVKQSKQTYYLNNKEKILAKNAEYVAENLDKVRKQHKIYYKENTEKVLRKNKEWRTENLEYSRIYLKEKYRNNSLFRLRCICREMVRRTYKNLKLGKNFNTKNFLGYTPLELKIHIEKQFKEGMTWDNHGEWHIDHRIPISQATTLEEGRNLSQLSNLQPLWAEENLKKYNKI